MTWNFRADGKLASVQDGAATRVALDYDAAGLLTAARYHGRTIQFTSDDQGRIHTIADPAGRSVSFTYSADGRLTAQSNADGSTVAYEYDGAGNLTTLTYSGGKYVVAYSGDADNLSVASVTTPDGAVRAYDVPRAPNEIRVTDGNGDATLYVSSAQGLLLSVRDPAGNTTAYTYDAAGNRTSVTNPAGETSRFTYDAAGNLTAVTDAADNRWAGDYSGGLLTRITDSRRNAWTFQYDDGGNLIGVTDPLSGARAASRTATGQIASLTDAAGNKSTWQYDSDALPAAFTDALGGKWSYSWDGAARAASRTDPGGGDLRASYNAHNRIASLGAGDAVLNFDYSGIRRDSLGRLATYTDSFGSSITYKYDPAGQLTSLTLPGSNTVTYQYDHLHRLSTVSDWAGNMAIYRYDTAGYPVSLSIAGGPVTIWQYDAARNLRAIVSTGADGMPVAGYRYTVDAAGNRTAVSALEPDADAGALTAYTFTYDAANRPTGRSDGQDYRYDARGNLSAISGSRTATFGYDPFGRLTSLAAGSTATYGYDSTGLRSVRGDRRYLWDPSGPRPRVVMESDPSGAPIAWYVYGLGLLWKVTADGTPYFYHFDGDGNVVAVSNTVAGVVNQYRYDPSGNLVSSHETVENLFRAHGQSGWIDDGNGLIFYRRRVPFPRVAAHPAGDGGSLAARAGPAAALARRRRLLPRGRGRLRLRRREGTLMRRLLLGLFFAAAAWSQALRLDCGQSQTLSFTSATSRYNLNFSGQVDEAVLIRVIPIPGTVTPGFGLNPPVLRDQYGNRVAPRTPDAAPIDIIGPPNGRFGYHYDLPGDGVYTLEVASVRVELTATVQIVLTRLNRPCTSATLSCGRSAQGSIAASDIGRMNTYQYSARAGDTISFRLLRVAPGGQVDTSTAFFMAVYGPDGTVRNTVNTNRLPLYPLAGRSDVTATANGTLTVVIWENSGVKGGAYYVSGVRLNGGCGGPALTCSSALDAQLTTPLSFASYTVSAAAGDVYQFRVGRADTAGTFTAAAEIYDAQGNRAGLVGPASPNGHAASSSVVRFAAGGSYSVLVSGSADGSAGMFTIASTRINRPCTDTTVACSAILDGSVSGVVRNRVYALTAAAGDTFLVRLLQPDPRSLFKPRVDILDSAGNQIQFLSTADLSRVNFTASTDGTYALLVTDAYDNAQSGSYSLGVTRLNRPCDASVLTCGGVVAGAIGRPLAAGVYTWNAAAAESFSVRMLGGAGGVLPSLEVYDTRGVPAGAAFTGAYSGVDVAKPAAGSYTVIALDNSRTPSAGSYSMELLRTKNACAAPLPQSQTASGVISATAPFAAYTISAAAGDTLALRSASSTNGFSAQMELYDPDGQRLDSGVFGLTRGIAAAGVYTVVLGGAAPRTAGGYAFTWQLMNRPAGAAPLPCGTSLAGSLAGANQFRYYTVAADAGDTMRLLFTRVDTFSPQMELFDPGGVRLTASSDVLQKAAAGGNYLVLVSPSTTAAETGSYTLAYQRPNNPCSPTSLTCGQTALKQVLAPGQLDTFTFQSTGGDLQTVRLTPRSGAYSPVFEVYDPSGTRVASVTTGQYRAVLSGGAYSLLVRDRGAVNLGSYRVSVQDDTSACPVDDQEAPVITLIRPTGGEVLPGGTTYRIQWVSDDNVGVASQDIALSTDGGQTFGTAIATGISGTAQTYDWILPPDIAPSRTAVLRITATDNAGNTQSAASGLLTLIGSGFTPNATGTFTYDPLNRLVQAALGDGRTVTWVWDAAGNLTQVLVSGQ